MDIRRHLEVISRWRRIAAPAFVLAVVLATLAAFKPSFDGGPKLEWRDDPTYTSTSQLFVTQAGFPWGRVTLPTPEMQLPTQGSKDDLEKFGDPERFATLAIMYSFFLQSADVQKQFNSDPERQEVIVTPVPRPGSDEMLPLLTVDANATTATRARQLNAAAIAALERFLKREMDRNDVAADDRIRLEVLNPPSPAKLTAGHSPTLPGVVFILVVVFGLGTIYVLESLHPRSRWHPPLSGGLDPADPDSWPALVEAGSGKVG